METAVASPVRNPKTYSTKEFVLRALREQPIPEAMALLDTPANAWKYWREVIEINPYLESHRENFAVLMLNTRKRVIGHHVTSSGTLDTLLVHPRDVFRAAIMSNAAAIIVMHNHPSGETSPSDADVKVTNDLIRAGEILRIEVLDHVIVGPHKYTSLRELGYWSR